jgi:hypothetical protein
MPEDHRGREQWYLFDVLDYVAFAMDPETRSQRADKAGAEARRHFNDKQQAFVDFVLARYVKQGVDELDAEKLSPLLKLQDNNALADTGELKNLVRWRLRCPLRKLFPDGCNDLGRAPDDEAFPEDEGRPLRPLHPFQPVPIDPAPDGIGMARPDDDPDVVGHC